MQDPPRSNAACCSWLLGVLGLAESSLGQGFPSPKLRGVDTAEP